MATHRTATAVGAVTLALAAVAAGCGGGGTKPSGSGAGPAVPAGASPTGSATPFSQTELEHRLLSLGDMPAGWQSVPDTVSSGSGQQSVTSSDPACQPLIDLGAPGKPPSSLAAAQSPQFSGSPNGPFIDENLASYATSAAAQAFLDKVTKALQGCKQFTETQPDGSKVDITVSPLLFPAEGDASTASRLGYTVQGMPVVSDAVVTRVGSTLIAVLDTNLQSTDPNLTQVTVDKAVAKVKNPASGAPLNGASGTATS